MHREELPDLCCLANCIAGKIKEDDFDGTCGTHTWVTCGTHTWVEENIHANLGWET
jgi:hypothetical protein